MGKEERNKFEKSSYLPPTCSDSNSECCGVCAFWQPNGGLLGAGYCLIHCFGYRRSYQMCDKFFRRLDGFSILSDAREERRARQLSFDFDFGD